jgi:hypothetical protein
MVQVNCDFSGGLTVAPNWSDIEVQATIANYFAMLNCELCGQEYSKAAHRRQLILLLSNRSEAAIERKHQNISAILLGMGLPYIDGYKPLGNYQALLETAVIDWLMPSERAIQFSDFAGDPVSPKLVPADTATVLVPMPKPLDKMPSPSKAMPRVGRRIDYARREAENRLMGRQGEEFVLNWEIKRLRQNGRDALAQKVEWVSEAQGDGLGYDIASFDIETEEPISIEVKTTRGGQYNPFFVTWNEAEVSRLQGGKYRLYRIFRFAIEPRIFIVPGPLNTTLILEPCTYRASLRP